MATRKIKNAKDLVTDELIYFKSHAQATFMSDGTTVEDKINGLQNGGGNLDLSKYVQKTELSSVATSGSYNDLSNKPTIPTKTSDLTNDSNFGKVATFEWDGATMSGTLSQDKYNEIAAANIVYIKIGDNITQFNKDVNEAGVIELSLTTFGEPFPVIGETSFTINTNRDYAVSTNFIDIPTKSSDLDDGANLLKSDNIKTVNGEDIVKGTDGVTDIKTQLAYAEYTGTATAAVVTTKYGYFPTTLVEGASVAVKFEGSLTYITTLDVNGTGAKNVYYKGNSLSSGTINRYNTYLFVYDGSYYRIVGIDTDTHYTAKNVVTSSSTSKSNATATNGNVRLNLIENSAVRSTHKIVGTGATTVTSDSSGNITIDTPIKTINGESIVGSGDITIEGGGGSAAYPEVDGEDYRDDVHIIPEYIVYAMQPNKFYVFPECVVLDIQFDPNPPSGIANEYLFQFTSGSTPTTLRLTDDIKWANDEAPVIEANKIYQISILKGLGSVMSWDNAPTLIDNKVTVSISGTKYLVSLQYAAASDIVVKVRTVDGLKSVNVLSGEVSKTASSLGPMVDSDAYIESITPIVDNKYNYIW